MAKPFLKWAGGKYGMRDQLLPLIPNAFARYHEPFMGAAGMFFAMQEAMPDLGQRAFLSDVNPRLVNSFIAIAHAPVSVHAALEPMGRLQYQYGGFREHFNLAIDPNTPSVELAAYFLYLNKTGFNGLYRENQKGLFNVPYGGPGGIVSQDTLMEAAIALRGATIKTQHFQSSIEVAGKDDFVYMDPPYEATSATSGFKGYHATAFRPADVIALRDSFVAADKRGAKVMLSESNTSWVRELWSGYHFAEVTAARRISAKAE